MLATYPSLYNTGLICGILLNFHRGKGLKNFFKELALVVEMCQLLYHICHS